MQLINDSERKSRQFMGSPSSKKQLNTLNNQLSSKMYHDDIIKEQETDVLDKILNKSQM